jgi:hypothetical protein
MTSVRARTGSIELDAGLADRALQRLVTRLAVLISNGFLNIAAAINMQQ